MHLAKQHLDIGLFSNQREQQLAFWQETVGLPYDHMGKVGGGVQQHRHHMNGSILKMNHSRDPLPAMAPSGIVGLQIAREGLSATQALADPDGNKVTLVPKGQDGVEGIAILLRVNDPAAHDRFWTHAMQYERVGEGRYRCGDSLVVIAEQGKVEHRGTAVARAGLSLHHGAGLGLRRRVRGHTGARRHLGRRGAHPGRDGALRFRLRSRRQSHRDQPARKPDRRPALGRPAVATSSCAPCGRRSARRGRPSAPPA